MMQDNRSSIRYGVRIEGKLMSPDMAFCVDVVIRNLSEGGAMVSALAPADAVPERVYLWQAQTRTLFECQVQWRKSDRLLGLLFTDECSRLSVRDLLEAASPAHVAAQSRRGTPAIPMRFAS
jgi:nitric oxide synthase oxygenase domain/subunit